MTGRNAHCHCGQLRIETTGEPFAVVMCHCRGCQQRTGAPYGVGAYFKADTCNILGSSNGYVRDGDKRQAVQKPFLSGLRHNRLLGGGV